MQRTDPAPAEASDRKNAPRLSYMPALDGLRGVALGMVILFHSNYEFARGGHLGVTVFFVLSGFLITSLLLVERETNGAISALRFWGRRARRLVPAALMATGLIAILAAFNILGSVPNLVGDGASALGWFANWRFILTERSYADIFGTPSPFRHFWSLAVEEQMYVVLPLVLIVATRRRIRRSVLAVILMAGIAGSTAASFLLHEGSVDRAYYGTDSRIAEPLVGALLAVMLLAPGGVKRLKTKWRAALDIASLGSLVGLAYFGSQLGVKSTRLYEGGFLMTAALSAVVVSSCSQPGSLVGRLLSAPPLVAVGRISYGAYLFHWPVFLWMTERTTRLADVQLLTVRLVVTLLLASVSYWIIESPVRTAQRFSPRLALGGWASGAAAALASLIFAAAQVPTTTSLAVGPGGGNVPPPPPIPKAAKKAPGKALGQRVGAGVQVGSALAAGGTVRMPETPGPDKGPGAAPPVDSGSLRVAVMGDSISTNLAFGLRAWSEGQRVTVYDLSFSACPFSRGGTRRLDNGELFPIPDGCDWWDDPTSERSRALAEFQPDVVILQDGTDELPDRKLDSWPSHRHPGDPTFDAWLRGEYSTLIRQYTKAGVDVLMLNSVCADWPRFQGWGTYGSRVDSLNATVFPAVAAEGARLADFNRRVCPTGKFSNTVEGIENARPDGIHFSDEASIALARRWLGPLVLEAKKPAPVPAG